jgi:hypothetical protein
MTRNKAEPPDKEYTYFCGGLLDAICLWAALVSNLPVHNEGDPSVCLRVGDLAVHHTGQVITARVLVAGVDPLLNRLGQPLGERQGDRGPGQLLGLELQQLGQQDLHLDHLLLRGLLLPCGVEDWREASSQRKARSRVCHHESLLRPFLVAVLEAHF